MNSTEKDPLHRRIEVTNWILLGTALLLSLIFTSLEFALGVLLGGLVSIINFHWLYRDLKKIFQQISDRPRFSIMFRYFIRLALTAIVLFLIITKTFANVIGLVIGLSLVVINIVINTIIITLFPKNNYMEVNHN